MRIETDFCHENGFANLNDQHLCESKHDNNKFKAAFSLEYKTHSAFDEGVKSNAGFSYNKKSFDIIIKALLI